MVTSTPDASPFSTTMTLAVSAKCYQGKNKTYSHVLLCNNATRGQQRACCPSTVTIVLNFQISGADSTHINDNDEIERACPHLRITSRVDMHPGVTRGPLLTRTRLPTNETTATRKLPAIEWKLNIRLIRKSLIDSSTIFSIEKRKLTSIR